MKTFHFIIQGKPGCGKSLLTYLFALKNETNARAFFVDVDGYTKTSVEQLRFLHSRSPHRFTSINMFDNNGRIDRQLIFKDLLELSQRDFDSFYFDFGATESQQFPYLFNKDYTLEEFKEIEEQLSVRFVFDVVVAGGSAYFSSANYLKMITCRAGRLFQTNLYANKGTFHDYPSHFSELKQFAANPVSHIHDVKEFGAFDMTSPIDKNVLRKIISGLGMDGFVPAEMIKIENELAQI